MTRSWTQRLSQCCIDENFWSLERERNTLHLGGERIIRDCDGRPARRLPPSVHGLCVTLSRWTKTGLHRSEGLGRPRRAHNSSSASASASCISHYGGSQSPSSEDTQPGLWRVPHADNRGLWPSASTREWATLQVAPLAPVRPSDDATLTNIWLQLHQRSQVRTSQVSPSQILNPQKKKKEIKSDSCCFEQLSFRMISYASIIAYTEIKDEVYAENRHEFKCKIIIKKT